MSYSGSCEVDRDRFTAIVTLKRHTDGHQRSLAPMDLTLRLEGTCPSNIDTYMGTADQMPGVLLEGTLILSEEASPTPAPTALIQPFKPDGLPKLPKRPLTV